MNRQIYGIVLFVVIVSFSVFTYEYLVYLRDSDCTAAENEKCAAIQSSTITYDYDFSPPAAQDVEVNLESVLAGMRSETVKTRMKLEWLGAGEPPKSVWIQLQFHNYDGSSAGWISEPVRINEPFAMGDRRQIEPVFNCDRCHNLPRNLYATPRLWNAADPGQKLIFEIKGMKPVVVQE